MPHVAKGWVLTNPERVKGIDPDWAYPFVEDFNPDTFKDGSEASIVFKREDQKEFWVFMTRKEVQALMDKLEIYPCSLEESLNYARSLTPEQKLEFIKQVIDAQPVT